MPYFFKWQRMKYQLLAVIVHDLIKTLSHTLFLFFFQTATLEISVSCFSSTWRYENIFMYFFKPQPFEISVSWFSSIWCNRTFSCTLFRYFFKPQRLIYQLLAFLVHDVIKHFPAPFETTTFEILVTCFSRTWRYKTCFRTFQTATLEISVSCFSSTWLYENIFLYFFKPQPFEISVSWFSSTWRYKNIFPYFFPRTVSDHNVWIIRYLLF